MEELRCEDYMAGRKGTAGGGTATGGLFGSSQPAGGGGLFGSQPASSSGGLFGQQQKPLFGTSGFGGTAPAAAAPAFGGGGFGQATTQTGGLFGAKPFGATTTSTTGFGGFGAQQPAQSGGLFGAQSKPFGSVAPQPAGGMFGAAPATGFLSNTGSSFTGFGQPSQPAAQPSIGLFGAQAQAKPAFGGFGATPASSTPAFGGFGTTTTAQSGGLFGSTAAKPAFGGFGAATSQPSTGIQLKSKYINIIYEFFAQLFQDLEVLERQAPAEPVFLAVTRLNPLFRLAGPARPAPDSVVLEPARQPEAVCSAARLSLVACLVHPPPGLVLEQRGSEQEPQGLEPTQEHRRLAPAV